MLQLPEGEDAQYYLDKIKEYAKDHGYDFVFKYLPDRNLWDCFFTKGDDWVAGSSPISAEDALHRLMRMMGHRHG